MLQRLTIRMRSMNAVMIVLVLLLPSLAFVPWAVADEGGAASRTGSRAQDNDLTVLGVTLPHDLDENIGSIVADNAIPVGSQIVQAEIKNIGNLNRATAIPVDFNIETSDPSTRWSDDMDGGANGWVAKDISQNTVHWHTQNANSHGTYALVSTYTSGPKNGYYGNWWEEVAEMANCVNVPVSPSLEPYVQVWNFTNTQSQSDGGLLQMQIGNGPWVDITPYNPFPPPDLSYRGNINSGTSVLSNGRGAYTGNTGWTQSEIFPLWQQQKGAVNGTCLKFRFWFTSDGSNPSDNTGWFVDDFTFFDGNSVAFSDTFPTLVNNNWVFKNINALGLSEGFKQLGGSGYNLSSKQTGTTGWWIGNTTKTTYLNGTDQVLESPSIALTGGGFNEARFTYWQKYNISLGSASANDGGWLELSTNGGTTWNYIEPLFDLNKADDNTRYPGYIDTNSDYGKIGAFVNNASWHKMTFDFTPYIGQTVKVRFHFWSNWDNKIDQGWFIDNAEVKTWNFQPKGTGSASVNGLNTGAKALVSLGQPFDFDTETDFRIRVIVDTAGDQDLTNNELHAIIRVKNIRDFQILPASNQLRSANHGSIIKFWLNISNIGNLNDNYTMSLSGVPAGWNASISPETITNLRPVDPPFQVIVTIQTTVDTGPTNYPDTTLQQKDFPMILTVQSENVQSLSQTKTLTARITNRMPTVTFLLENLQGKVYTPLEISQPLSGDLDKDPLTFIWTWGDGSAVTNTTTWPVYHTYKKSKSAANPYVITLKVTDGLATSAETKMNITITNSPPVAKFVISSPIAVNNTYAAGDLITFNATAPAYSKDENSTSLKFSWLFGDGNTETGPIVTNSYATGGKKTVTLTVMDEEDVLATTELNITINTPPTPVITTPTNEQEFYIGESVIFNASATTDNEQLATEMEFLWSSNRKGDLGNQVVFTMSFTDPDNDVGVHVITLKVNDHKAKGISTITRSITIKARPQNAPTLNKDTLLAAVSPDGGFISDTTFTYSIIYKDNDNDKPSYLRLVIDKNTTNEKIYDMEQKDPTDKAYSTGVLFQKKIPGNGIGADSIHTFHFETADERAIGVMVKSIDFTGPRITREKLVQNQGAGNIPAGVVFAKVRYVGRQDQDPVKVSVLDQPQASPPMENGTALLSIGLNVTFSEVMTKDKWDYANLSFRYGADAFRVQRDLIDLSTVQLYKLESGSWVKVTNAENDETGMVVSLNNVQAAGTYGLFGAKKKIVDPCELTNTCTTNKVDNTMYILAAIIIAAVVAVVVGVVLLTRKKKARESKWGGKDGIDLKIDVLSGQGTDEAAVMPVEGGAAETTAAVPMETTTGESVAIYRPAVAQAPAGESEIESAEGEGVAVYRPGVAPAPTDGEEEPPAPVEEAPAEGSSWTPPPATESEEAPAAPPVDEQSAQEPKKDEQKGKDEDLLNEILGEEK